jgi:hypothetical protein
MTCKIVVESESLLSLCCDFNISHYFLFFILSESIENFKILKFPCKFSNSSRFLPHATHPYFFYSYFLFFPLSSFLFLFFSFFNAEGACKTNPPRLIRPALARPTLESAPVDPPLAPRVG